MRNLIYFLAGGAVLLLFTVLLFLNKEKAEPAEKISGAYEALNFLGEAQTYPSGHLPAKAHFAAWQSSLNMDKAETNNRSTNPWETMGPHNRGGRTLALAFNPQNPNTMYAGSASGGLWRSYTGGVGKDAWQRVETGYPAMAVSCIEFMPGDSMQMFIGTGEVYNYEAAGTGAAYRNTRGNYGIGILRSSDGGVTWEKSLDFSYDQNKGVWDIEVAHSNPAAIYAATTDGVYKSTDAGSTWEWVFDIPLATDLVVHPADPDKVVVGCGNFSSPGFGIYRTTDGGNFWHKITENLPTDFQGKIQLGLAPSNPETIYASIGNGFSSAEGASWLCRSEDFGATWEIKNTTDYSQHQGWYSHDVTVHPQNPDVLIAIGIDVWKSTDGGESLFQISSGNPGGVGLPNPPIEGPDGGPEFVHSDCHDVIYHPTNPNVLYVASDGGIHRSTDGGESFHSCNGRYQTAQFYNGFSNSAQNPNFCMGGLQDNGTVRWNEPDPVTGETVTWTRVFGGDGSWTGINQQNGNYSYVSWQTLNMLRNTDGGINYSSLSVPKQGPISFIAPFVLAPSNGMVIYAGSSTIAKSSDGGNSWATTNGGLPLDGNPMLSLSISHQNPNVVYAASAPYGGNRSHLFISQNGGSTWTNITEDLPDRFPMDLEVDPTDEAVAYVSFSGFGTGHVFRTTDNGASWEDISAELPDVPTNAIAVDPLFPQNIYVGNDLGIFASVDNGLTWQSYKDGMPEATMVFDLKISPAHRKLRAATHGNGAFQRDLLEEPFMSSAGVKNEPEIRLDISPNPASEKATLRLYLPEAAALKVEIFDGNGQVVKASPKEKQAAGWQERDLMISDLPAGVYFVRVSGEKMMGIKKLLVSRN